MSDLSNIMDYDYNTGTKECKGLMFRYTERSYFNKKRLSVESKSAATLLKRKSCDCGCIDLLESMDEMMESGSVYFPDDAKDGDILRLTVTNIQRDPETNYVDGYDYTFVLNTPSTEKGALNTLNEGLFERAVEITEGLDHPFGTPYLQRNLCIDHNEASLVLRHMVNRGIVENCQDGLNVRLIVS